MKKGEKACLSHSKAILRQAKRRESQSFLSAGRKPGVFHPGRDAARQAAMDLIRGGPFAPSGSPAAHGSAHGAAVPGQTRKGEKAEAFSRPGETRSFSPGPRRRPPGGNGSHPWRALRPLGLPRGARVCTRRGCSGANKKRRESQSFLSLKGIRSNYLTRLRVT